MSPSTSGAASAAAGSEEPLAPPDFPTPSIPRPWPSLDRLGALQASGGLILGLIALLSSNDHLSLAGHRITLQQQWGIPCIAASVATVFI